MERQTSLRTLAIAAGVAAALGIAAPAAFADTSPTSSPSTSTASGTSSTDTSGGYGNSSSSTSPSDSASMGGANVVSDSDLTTQVKAKLASMSNLQGSNIVVSTKEGKVTLTGTVTSKDAEAAAKSAAQSVPGVKKVDDDLKKSKSSMSSSSGGA